MNHGADFRTHESECMRVKCSSFSPPSAELWHMWGQEPRTRSQGPGPKDQGTKDSACMGRARGQEPRTKVQESQGPRTKDHAGAKDHVGVEMIKKEWTLHAWDRPDYNKGPRPTCRDPHACMEGHSLCKNWQHIASNACHCMRFFQFVTRLRSYIYRYVDFIMIRRNHWVSCNEKLAPCAGIAYI